MSEIERRLSPPNPANTLAHPRTYIRFECFITKELSHPNCVSLIGVSWDDNMLACVIEYVDGGSLEGRFRSDWPLPFKEKIKWPMTEIRPPKRTLGS